MAGGILSGVTSLPNRHLAPPWACDGLEVVETGVWPYNRHGILLAADGDGDPWQVAAMDCEGYILWSGGHRELAEKWQPAEQPPQDVAEAGGDHPAWLRDDVDLVGLGSFAGKRGRAFQLWRGWQVLEVGTWGFLWQGTAQEIGALWIPASAPAVAAPESPRPLVEICGAVLHELRTSGPLGLDPAELEERIQHRLVAKAIGTLADEGRVVIRDGRVRMTEALRDVERFTSESVAAGEKQIALEKRISRLETERDLAMGALDEARDKLGGALREISLGDKIMTAWRRVLDALPCPAHDSPCVPYAEAKIALLRDDAEAWREVALALLDVLAPQSREDHPGAADDARARVEALQGLLVALGEAPGLEGSAVELAAYTAGLSDAHWMLARSKAPHPPRIPIARFVLGDGSVVRCAVLGWLDGDTGVFSAPGTGRVLTTRSGFIRYANGMTCSPVGEHLHPEDLAALRGEDAALTSNQGEG